MPKSVPKIFLATFFSTNLIKYMVLRMPWDSYNKIPLLLNQYISIFTEYMLIRWKDITNRTYVVQV